MRAWLKEKKKVCLKIHDIFIQMSEEKIRGSATHLTFMNIQIRSDSMACAMPVVKTIFPQWGSSKNVKRMPYKQR
jgi:hypothetical protein